MESQDKISQKQQEILEVLRDGGRMVYNELWTFWHLYNKAGETHSRLNDRDLRPLIESGLIQKGIINNDAGVERKAMLITELGKEAANV